MLQSHQSMSNTSVKPHDRAHRWHSPVVLLPISWDDADIERSWIRWIVQSHRTPLSLTDLRSEERTVPQTNTRENIAVIETRTRGRGRHAAYMRRAHVKSS